MAKTFDYLDRLGTKKLTFEMAVLRREKTRGWWFDYFDRLSTKKLTFEMAMLRREKTRSWKLRPL